MAEIAQSLLRFAGTAQGVLILIALAVAIVAFACEAKARARIDRAMAGAGRGSRLTIFDLSHGDIAAAQRQRRLVVPERLWTYDEAYLARFAQAASQAGVGKGLSALDLYVRQVLRRFDMLFAVALAAFAVLVDIAIAQLLAAPHPLWSRVAWIAACMGLNYGAADVAEDCKLAKMLAQVVRAGDDLISAVDAGEAAAANVLTRVKLVAIVLSGVGVALFLVLSVVEAIVIRPPWDAAGEVALKRA
jgi:hypothetical protein